MSKKDNRLNLKDKEGSKSALIGIIFAILIIVIVLSPKIFNYFPVFNICGESCPSAGKILLNYPIHYIGGFFIWYYLVKIFFKFFIKSEWMDKNKHEFW